MRFESPNVYMGVVGVKVKRKGTGATRGKSECLGIKNA